MGVSGASRVAPILGTPEPWFPPLAPFPPLPSCHQKSSCCLFQCRWNWNIFRFLLVFRSKVKATDLGGNKTNASQAGAFPAPPRPQAPSPQVPPGENQRSSSREWGRPREIKHVGQSFGHESKAFAVYRFVETAARGHCKGARCPRGLPAPSSPALQASGLPLTCPFSRVRFLQKFISFFLMPSLTEGLVIFIGRNVLSKTELRHPTCWAPKSPRVSSPRPLRLSPGAEVPRPIPAPCGQIFNLGFCLSVSAPHYVSSPTLRATEHRDSRLRTTLWLPPSGPGPQAWGDGSLRPNPGPGCAVRAP